MTTWLYAGVDGGGTGCRARIYQADGTPLGQGHGGRANLLLGVENVRQSVDDAIAQALKHSGLSPDDVSRLKVGLALASAEHRAAYDAFLALPHPYAAQVLNTDALGACLAVNQGKDAGVVIAGTGSCGLAWQNRTITAYGGHEFPISDQGSGARLGLAALQHTYDVLQGWCAPSALSQRINDFFSAIVAPTQAANTLDALQTFSQQAKPGDYAQFARHVFDCAQQDDTVSHALLAQTASEIGLLLAAVARHTPPRLSLMGSIGLHIRPWLADEWQSQLAAPMGDALDGARLIACHDYALYR
ncbi:BadF/BadG/BcrA/BcrD ATPase family protein [Pectobacterium carotovorum subsp. carotovorum]|uniref:BadF/BadG/BcrA/BcrD ATPase family protein n=1 Tax=Pectobacterium carotovorum TaxID=554 RepID=UPI00057FFF98|nr:BadF/BadG/BcrA/BcrD ATPase family protein [Pectobacterium carotovorum]KHT33081.1 glucosamine kinase [Pectobacterium carotovorum subsp. carotovorum]MCA6971377.1 glucosamine kinase [Pectobacterium carotovorum]WDF98281.1 BadF/BadG/BcrA/BcrD ATPase family protein [Pectobacterium carotovorum subsp. carotovorum]